MGAAPVAAAPDNRMRLRDASGQGARDYPLRLGRPFMAGEIARFPQVVIAGLAIPTQADVKTRWPDGSVRHAILSLIVPRIPSGGSVEIRFREQPTANDAPLSGYAHAASTFLVAEPGAPVAYDWLRRTVYGPFRDRSAKAAKCALLPRA